MTDVRHVGGVIRPSGVERHRALAELATRQQGVVAYEQLRDAGFSPDAIKQMRAARRIVPLYRGVYAVGHGRVSSQGRLMAAVLAGGAGTVVSHRSAGAHWSFAPSSAKRVDVITPRRTRRKTANLFPQIAQLAPDELTIHEGIPVTTVARTFIDMAEVVAFGRLERAFEAAERLRLLDVRALERQCERSFGRRGPPSSATASAMPRCSSPGARSCG